jgi:glutamate-1-semialdehyde 2,1-aminomutase
MKLERSRQIFERARQVIAGGVSSNVRASDRPFPLCYARGKGSKLLDVDGNEYLDFVMGRGPLILGHSHPALIKAVQETMVDAQLFAAQTEMECEVAETIKKHIPSMEMVRFANSGSEAVHAALRLARFATHRPKIVKFEGHYHGWLDNILFAAPEKARADQSSSDPSRPGNGAAGTADLLIVPWNNLPALEAAFNAHGPEIAAVIMEPVMCNSGCVLPQDGYLEGVRKLCSSKGALLIFDEVITGFRMGLTGAQGRYGVVPDLTVLGKALAGGFILSSFGGKRELMNLIAELKVVHAGTFNGNPISLSAAITSLRILEERKDEFPLLNEMGDQLRLSLVKLANQFSLPCASDGFGMIFCFYLTTAVVSDPMECVKHRDAEATSLFQERMLNQGIRIAPEGTWFLSFAHDQKDVELALNAAKNVLAEIAASRVNSLQRS